MTKYKLSLEVRAAEKARKEQIRGLLTGLEIKDFSDIQELFEEMAGEVLQALWPLVITPNFASDDLT